MIFDHYDRIRVVNLPERRDRRRDMETELAKVGLSGDPRVEFFSAIRMQDSGPFKRVGSHGAFLSHLEILKEARAAGQNVLILQDDCSFLPDIRRYEPSGTADIFYGGYVASDPSDLANSNIIGAHFMGFSREAVSKAVPYLEEYLKPDFPSDPIAMENPEYNPTIRPPIDGAFVWFRRSHPELETEFYYLADQRPSATDVGDRKWFDRLPVTRNVANFFRRFM